MLPNIPFCYTESGKNERVDKMKRNMLAKGAIRLVLAATLVTGGTLIANAETSSADSMGCYGWFDYVYKSTGDLNFANWHYEQCRSWNSAVKAQLAPILLQQPLIPIDGSAPVRPTFPIAEGTNPVTVVPQPDRPLSRTLPYSFR
jgi:hypothetical protein